MLKKIFKTVKSLEANMATKADVDGIMSFFNDTVATKEDLLQFYTKEEMDTKFTGIDNQFMGIDNRFIEVRTELSDLKNDIRGLDGKVDGIQKDVRSLKKMVMEDILAFGEDVAELQKRPEEQVI